MRGIEYMLDKIRKEEVSKRCCDMQNYTRTNGLVFFWIEIKTIFVLTARHNQLNIACH